MKTAFVAALALLAACRAPADRPAEPTSMAATAGQAAVVDTTLPVMTVYKSPSCGCCGSWVDAVRAAGFRVDVHDVNDVTPVKADAGVPEALHSCHTAIIGGYAIEGHVPPETIKKFLREHPNAAGLSVPGMVVGTPGMEVPGQPAQHYDVIAFQANGASSVYESH